MSNSNSNNNNNNGDRMTLSTKQLPELSFGEYSFAYIDKKSRIQLYIHEQPIDRYNFLSEGQYAHETYVIESFKDKPIQVLVLKLSLELSILLVFGQTGNAYARVIKYNRQHRMKRPNEPLESRVIPMLFTHDQKHDLSTSLTFRDITLSGSKSYYPSTHKEFTFVMLDNRNVVWDLDLAHGNPNHNNGLLYSPSFLQRLESPRMKEICRIGQDIFMFQLAPPSLWISLYKVSVLKANRSKFTDSFLDETVPVRNDNGLKLFSILKNHINLSICINSPFDGGFGKLSKFPMSLYTFRRGFVCDTNGALYRVNHNSVTNTIDYSRIPVPFGDNFMETQNIIHCSLECKYCVLVNKESGSLSIWFFQRNQSFSSVFQFAADTSVVGGNFDTPSSAVPFSNWSATAFCRGVPRAQHCQ